MWFSDGLVSFDSEFKPVEDCYSLYPQKLADSSKQFLESSWVAG
jgi:hypothetical protein